MRRWAWVLWGALAGWAALQSRRVGELEQRVERLARGAGTTEHGNTAQAALSDADRGRLDALDDQLVSVEERLAALEDGPAHEPVAAAAPGGGEPAASEEARQILSVVEREQRRVMEKQIAYHRERWIEQRQAALDDFAARQALSPAQTQRVHKVLLDEIDALFEILGSRETAENPDRAGRQMREMLEKNDQVVAQFLNPAQQQAWLQGRAFERAVFMPWLPKY